MNYESKIVTRLTLASRSEESANNVPDILKLLPTPTLSEIIGQRKTLSDGRIFPTPNKETIHLYETTLHTFTIQDCNQAIMDSWIPHAPALQQIRQQSGYQIHLNYEVTIFDSCYPALIFDPAFLAFMGELAIEFSLYFYQDSVNGD